MDNDTIALLTGLLGTALGTLLFGSAIVGAYLFGRSKAKARNALGDRSAADALERIERRLESLEVEVERQGENLRYTARLMGQALPAAPSGAGEGRAVSLPAAASGSTAS